MPYRLALTITKTDNNPWPINADGSLNPAVPAEIQSIASLLLPEIVGGVTSTFENFTENSLQSARIVLDFDTDEEAQNALITAVTAFRPNTDQNLPKLEEYYTGWQTSLAITEI